MQWEVKLNAGNEWTHILRDEGVCSGLSVREGKNAQAGVRKEWAVDLIARKANDAQAGRWKWSEQGILIARKGKDAHTTSRKWSEQFI